MSKSIKVKLDLATRIVVKAKDGTVLEDFYMESAEHSNSDEAGNYLFLRKKY